MRQKAREMAQQKWPFPTRKPFQIHSLPVNEMTLYRCVDFSWKIIKLLNIGSEAMLRKSLKVVDEFVYNLIKSKTETVANSGDDLHLKRRDILSRLLASGQTDPKYFRDIIFSLFVAGKDTAASTLTWFIYMVCKHPDIQEKIAQEVREATNLKDNSSIDELADNLTEETLSKMQYLVAALTETSRLYPAVPLNAKVCSSDDTWPDGFSVKKGDIVGYHAYSMGRMKYIWGDVMISSLTHIAQILFFVFCFVLFWFGGANITPKSL
ncbi:cytochrome P450 704C1 [Prunus persica]|uniref:cytochrome P450 704C1 n=1 Tax=Prunus persica TaxID=3760 RepID=UPI0009AB6EFF|nr:cytochrome P450 704C1 [Prunus persica]